jgi:DNA-binding response OmpR family regulator
VEDDRSARRAISAILRLRGFAVSESGCVAEALRVLSDRVLPPPDWILLDLMLPDGSGIDVMREVRTRGLTSKICIVTGCCTELLREARLAGADHLFTKPLDVKGLICALITQEVGET